MHADHDDHDDDEETGPICFPEPQWRTLPAHPGKMGVRFHCEKCGATGEAVYGAQEQIDTLTRAARALFFSKVACEMARGWGRDQGYF